jgi:hypothetical protein
MERIWWMTETIRIWSNQYQLLIEAAQKSVENLHSGTEGVIEVDKTTLIAILALLRFHPDEEVSKSQSDKIQRLIREEDQAPKLAEPATPEIRLSETPPQNGDPMMDVINLIADYGKFYGEWKKAKKDSE